MMLIISLVYSNGCCYKRAKLRYYGVCFPLQQYFPLCYTRFSKVSKHLFCRDLGKTVQGEIVCSFQSFVCPVKLRKGFFLQQKSQIQLQLYCVQNQDLDQYNENVSQFLCSYYRVISKQHVSSKYLFMSWCTSACVLDLKKV